MRGSSKSGRAKDSSNVVGRVILREILTSNACFLSRLLVVIPIIITQSRRYKLRKVPVILLFSLKERFEKIFLDELGLYNQRRGGEWHGI